MMSTKLSFAALIVYCSLLIADAYTIEKRSVIEATTDLDKATRDQIVKDVGHIQGSADSLYKEFQDLDKEKKGSLAYKDIFPTPATDKNTIGYKVQHYFFPTASSRMDFKGYAEIRLIGAYPYQAYWVDLNKHAKDLIYKILFQEFDADQNNKLSLSEFKEYAKEGGAGVQYDKQVFPEPAEYQGPSLTVMDSRHLSQASGFTEGQIKTIYKEYTDAKAKFDTMDYAKWSKENNIGLSKDQFVGTFEQFVMNKSFFRPAPHSKTLDQKLAYVFSMLDFNKDGSITLDEMQVLGVPTTKLVPNLS